ncbi:MAG TPA: gamma carbonic anhydrase family protein [Clostridia bacterium]|nr:gamma carbonic anhydrase family protein [Clostridia bacterium]
MIKSLKDKQPDIGEDVYISPLAFVAGDVKIGKGSSIWPGASLRADLANITIGEYSNIQDNASVHVNAGVGAVIGNNVTIGHNAVVHACTIADNCLIGMGAVVLDGAYIEENCIIGAGAVVPPGKRIPTGSLVVGVPGKIIRELGKEEKAGIVENAKVYAELARIYSESDDC